MASYESNPGPAPAAHVLIDETGTSLAGCGATVLVVGGVLWVVAIANASIIWSVILGLLLLVATAVLVGGVMEMRRWDNLELHFADWPLAIGSTTRVRVIRRAKRPVPDAEYELTAELTCTESATYMDGTDQRTATDEVVDEDLTVTGTLAQNVFDAVFDLHIPHDRGAPGMDLGSNKIEWKLDIDVDELSRVMAKMTFTLDVVPTLDPHLRNIQDTLAGDA